MSATQQEHPHAGDDAELAEHGYRQRLNRSLGGFSSFAAGFSYISILTGMFQLFGFGYGFGGPILFWAWLIVFGGQFCVALVFAELSARYPIAGSVYQWSKKVSNPSRGLVRRLGHAGRLRGHRRRRGDRLADRAAAHLVRLHLHPQPDAERDLPRLLRHRAHHDHQRARRAGDGVHQQHRGGRGAHRRRADHRAAAVPHPPLARGALHRPGGRARPARLDRRSATWRRCSCCVVMPAYVMFGFDTAGSLSEETKDPRRTTPRALLRALGAAGVAGALLLLMALLTAKSLDLGTLGAGGLPSVLEDALGSGVGKVLLADVAFAIFICCLAIHAASIRLAFSMARDHALPFGDHLSHVSEQRQVARAPGHRRRRGRDRDPRRQPRQREDLPRRDERVDRDRLHRLPARHHPGDAAAAPPRLARGPGPHRAGSSSAAAAGSSSTAPPSATAPSWR